MIDFDRICEVKSIAQARLFAIPGVHAVGIGSKIVAGKRVSEPAIAVFVVKKKASSDLTPDEIIPAEIEGIKTDVIEQSVTRLLSGTGADAKVHRPLTGGIRLEPGGVFGGRGTLGFIARTSGPQSRIVGVTCHHVLAQAESRPTSLTVDRSGDTWTFGGTNTPGTIVAVETSSKALGAYLTTGPSDTPSSIASNIAAAVTNLANPGISATASGAAVTITVTLSSSVYDVRVFGPHETDKDAKLRASIASSAVTHHVITLSGDRKNDYGIYTNVNVGGARDTFSVFAPVSKSDSLNAVASRIAALLTASITKQGISGVTASASGAQVTIDGAQQVECDVSSDVRVGQPDKTFGCSTSWCTNHRIGRVFDSRQEVDAALVQLDAGLKYKAEIPEIGLVTGVYEVTNTDVVNDPALPHREYPVKKRGAATGLTSGQIFHLNIDGFTDDTSPGGFFGGRFSGAMQVGVGLGQSFGESGDSGSAVVNDSGEIVGILFGVGFGLLGSGSGAVMPIKRITAALGITVETATSAGIIRVVPNTVIPREMLGEDETEGASIPARPSAALRDRLMEVGTEIAATPSGREYAEMVQRHIPETQTLINTHRRVGAVWRRNGGNQIVQSFLEMVQWPDRRLPVMINGRPVTECLRRIQKALARYGSAELIADLRRFGPMILELSCLTYPQILDSLRAAEAK